MNILLTKKSLTDGQLFIVDGRAAMGDGESVAQMVAARPQRARVFEKWGIAYCCGRHTLEQACYALGIEAEAVRADLRACDEQANLSAEGQGTDWSQWPLAVQTDFIVRVHHQYLCDEMPRLSQCIERIAEDHGAAFSEFWEMQGLFEDFREQIENHIRQQEIVLFPLLQSLENANKPLDNDRDLSQSVNLMRLICHQQAENISLRASLMKLIAWTRDFQPPARVCNTYRVFLHGLSELETALTTHLSEEEDSLFSRSLTLISPAGR